MSDFEPNEAFKKDYDKLYETNPYAANTLLLMCELADKKGRVESSEEELFKLFQARFNDPEEYSL